MFLRVIQIRSIKMISYEVKGEKKLLFRFIRYEIFIYFSVLLEPATQILPLPRLVSCGFLWYSLSIFWCSNLPTFVAYVP